MDRGAWLRVPPTPDAAATMRTKPADLLAVLRCDPRQAIEEERIVCLVCAEPFRQLTNTHLRSHQLTAAEYKVRFGYNRGRPLMCRALARLYAQRAVQNGLADRIRSRPILAEPALRRRGGMRPVTLEELLTRRDARRAAGGGGP
ncbi:MAG TPA: MucR family transcriptional regulator [Candidatus Bathyarchaeia archaeon]|nr:MucR family transcriptional regulator [Candidatus Bathyarchaeia archaeon]